jgi:NAD(P)H-hydrate epimerase
MTPLTRQQVRSLDGRAIEELGVPGVVLMENAGRGAADHIEKFFGAGGARGKRIAVVAGAGNNGGDGYVVARHLHIRGATVAVFLVADPAKIAGDARTNLNIIQRLGVDVREVSHATDHGAESDITPPRVGALNADGKRSVGFEAPTQRDDKVENHAIGQFAMGSLSSLLRDFDLVVDAVGGTGIRGPLKGSQAAAVEQINAAGVPVVALDIPTGLDCDTGVADGPAVRAALTVTFAARKIGFDAPGAEAYTGKVVVADIGVPVAE